MEQKEMMQKFESLYNTMANSNEPKYMNIFGETMKAMMGDIIKQNPELACDYIGRLYAIEWDNYLTRKEALDIADDMTPKGAWDAEEWEKTMDELSIRKDDKPYYNKWALFTTMNMVYSDSANSIAAIAGKTLEEMTSEEIFTAVHMLALDKLEDKDGIFDIRYYFHI